MQRQNRVTALSYLIKSEHSNGIGKDIYVIAVIRKTDMVSPYHTFRSNRVQIVDIHIARLLTLNAEQAVLARVPIAWSGARCGFLSALMMPACSGKAGTLTGVVVVVKAVQACSVDVDVLGIDYAQTPSIACS